MNVTRTAVAAALAGMLALAQGPALGAAPAHDHAQAAGAPTGLTLDHGRRWTTDAPLRQRMGEIRAFLAPHLAAIHRGTLPAAEYRALGAAVEHTVAAIIAECKLPPEADAMLHLVVADLHLEAHAIECLHQAGAHAHSLVGGREVEVATHVVRDRVHRAAIPLEQEELGLRADVVRPASTA